ncbi:MAG TPA: lasso peptide biosynthesis B2 protein [Novosphingobium sp.]|nr:lasso peptide biosynthesis B2 protein [Novosphingobium sp.]
MTPGTELSQRSSVLKRPVVMLAGFARMPMGEKLALVAAWTLLAGAAAALRLFPFRRLAPLLGKALGPAASVPVIDQRQTDSARLIRRAVLRAARLAPFRSDCLPQALAGAALCRMLRVPATVFLGVRLNDGPSGMAAHAWLCAGAAAVTGGQSFERFTVVAAFALPGSKR